MSKVVIVGAGSVGTTIACTLQITGVATEIVLLDSNHELAKGQVMDMNHGIPFVPTDVIIITVQPEPLRNRGKQGLISLIEMLKYARALSIA